MIYINLNASVYLTNILIIYPTYLVIFNVDRYTSNFMSNNKYISFFFYSILEYQTTHSSWAWILVLFYALSRFCLPYVWKTYL